jgi:hypothetical protein
MNSSLQNTMHSEVQGTIFYEKLERACGSSINAELQYH